MNTETQNKTLNKELGSWKNITDDPTWKITIPEQSILYSVVPK